MKRRFGTLLAIVAVALLVATAASAQTITVATRWAEESKQGQGLDASVELFKQRNPNVGVNVVYGVDGERFQVLLAVGSAPDVWVGASGWDVFTMGSAGALLSLDRYIQADARWRHNDFMPVAFGNAVVDGVTYAMPTHLSGVIFFWNKDHFAEAGLDPAQPPAFDDLDNYHRRLTMQDNLGNITQIGSMPYAAYDYANAILLWGYARGARSILEPGERAFSMTQTEMVDAAAWLKHHWDEFPPAAAETALGSSSHTELFSNGKLSMATALPNLVQLTAEAGGYEIGVAPPPSVSGENVTPVSAYQAVALASSRNPAIAYEFLRHISADPDGTYLLHSFTGDVPSYLRSRSWDDFRVRLDPVGQAARAMASSIMPWPLVPFDYKAIIRAQMNELFNGSADPRSALLEAERQLNAELDAWYNR